VYEDGWSDCSVQLAGLLRGVMRLWLGLRGTLVALMGRKVGPSQMPLGVSYLEPGKSLAGLPTHVPVAGGPPAGHVR
jgi:hypothetical protein